ncbi:hypothetical protein CRI94_02015 [Longibacter salinarum]|uniref:Mutator family transposase n=1 Tax=Longibacter salinarum TaxID=1850348 RepID=A0A2A8D2P0_9BACT|nr:hypothetical protein CRI94_02015 [Longibacter salinarum]
MLFDALQIEVRHEDAVRATTVVIGVDIGTDRQRELLRLHLSYSKTEGGWHRFIERLKARGLSGVRVATSDAHDGLRLAVNASFPGLIARCTSGAT